MEPELPPEYLSTPTELEVCGSCGRKFNLDTLVRHKEICIKNHKKSIARKPFDSGQHRAMGTDLENYNSQRKYKSTEDRLKMIAYERNAQKKKQWKRKHEDFIATIMTAREYDIAQLKGRHLPPPKPSAPNPDYVQCPHCKRRFQEHVAERHIPFCKEKNSRIDYRNTSRTSGNLSLNKRLTYKPPTIRKRTETEGHSECRPSVPSLVQRRKKCASTCSVSENGNGSTFDSSEDDSGKGADCCIHAYQDEPSCEHGALDKLATKVKTVETQVDSLSATAESDGLVFDEEGMDEEGFSGERMLIGSSGASLQLVEGTSKQHLPGNTNGHFEPHPPNKIPPPRFRSRLVHLKQTPENRTDNSMVAETSHAKMANVYLSELDEQDYYRHMDSSNNHSHSIGQQPWRTREGELVSHRDQQQHPLMSKINSNTTLSDTSIIRHNGYTSDTHDYVTSTRSYMSSVRDRSVNSNSSSTGSSSSRNKQSQLNAHGMIMSKFCYECGSGFPVPQAKYCCECGTKRI